MKFHPVWTPNHIACGRRRAGLHGREPADLGRCQGTDAHGEYVLIERYAEHSANERTFLAWVRTVIAIEGFGIVASRIGDAPGYGWSEAAMLSAGALVIGLAFARMRRIRKGIDAVETVEDAAIPADALLLLVTLALFGLIGAFAVHVG